MTECIYLLCFVLRGLQNICQLVACERVSYKPVPSLLKDLNFFFIVPVHIVVIDVWGSRDFAINNICHKAMFVLIVKVGTI